MGQIVKTRVNSIKRKLKISINSMVITTERGENKNNRNRPHLSGTSYVSTRHSTVRSYCYYYASYSPIPVKKVRCGAVYFVLVVTQVPSAFLSSHYVSRGEEA